MVGTTVPVTTVAGEQPLMTPFRWDRLSAASALSYCLLVAGLSVGVVLGELRSDFGLSGFVTALHGSTFGIGLIVVGIRGVGLVDRFGRRRALSAAAAAMAAGVTLFCIGPVWPVTLAGTALSGAGGALLVMIMPGLINDHHGPRRAQAFAAINGIPGIAGVIFSLAVGLALTAGWSWRPVYLAITLTVLAALIKVARPVALPPTARHGAFTLRHLLDRRRVMIPSLFLANALLTEFSIGVWATAYLKEIGGASSGLAPVLASTFGIMIFLSRLVMPFTLRVLGEATISLSFVAVGLGASAMCFGPGLAAKVTGLSIAAFGGAPLYPLTIDRLYRRAGHVDAVSLGAIAALANGAAVTIGPLALGVLADGVGLRWAILFVPVLCVTGAITQRPSTSVRNYSMSLRE